MARYKEFDNGVDYYTQGKAEIVVNFPENQIVCRWCPFCRAESELSRFWCRLTNTMIYNPGTGISGNCPLNFENEKE